jgi:hypothetical protein
MKVAALLVLVSIFSLSEPATAAAKKYTVSGKVNAGNGYTVMLVQKNGVTKSAALSSSGNFSFRNRTLSQLRAASLQLIDPNGRYAGPVVLGKKGSKVSVTFSGKAAGSSDYVLGKINLKSGYASVKNTLKKEVFSAPKVRATSGKPVGAGEFGLVEAPAPRVHPVRAAASDDAPPGADADLDGIPDVFDADDDGDLVLDGSDPDSAGLDIPYSTLNLDLRRALNSHVRAGLSDSAIEAVIGGENMFNLIFFFSLPSGSTVDGGFMKCDDALTYCRKNTPLAYSGGVSESSSEFRDHPWSELLNSDGFPRLEKLTINGSFDAVVAAIQPRVPRTEFRPGDVYQVALTTGSEVTQLRSLALSPHFVSVPAVKEYDAGFGTVQVDYNAIDAVSGSIPGVSDGAPIVLDSDGILTVTFWRPQREALRSDETGYYDWGNLHYGMIVEGAQATCAGYYSSVSDELTADSSPLGDGDSPLSSAGANLYPYTDSRGDRAADSGNTLTFTVNLKDCRTRGGLSAGLHRVDLTAAGEQLTGGFNSATLAFHVQIP